MGLIVVVLFAPIGDVDLLADPLGWLLVLGGLAHLPETLPLRGVSTALAALALAASIPLTVPAVRDALDDADDALAWAANLPWLLFLLTLALGLGRAAFEADDRRAAAWWRCAQVGAMALIALPVLVFGGGLTGLEDTTGVAVGVVPLAFVLLLFLHGSRPWALPMAEAPADDGPAP